MSKSGKITDVRVKCPACGWKGALETTAPDVDGDGSPGCPICFCNVIATKARVIDNDNAPEGFPSWDVMRPKNIYGKE